MATESDAGHQRMNSPVQGTRRRRRRASAARRWVIGLSFALLLLLLLGAGAVGAGVYGAYQLYGWIVPGVHVGELDLSGMTWHEAQAGLEKVYGVEHTLLITDGSRFWEASASEFGFGYDVRATVQQALNVAHGKAFREELLEMFDSLIHEREIEPVFVFDPLQARSKLDSLKSTVHRSPVDASLRLQGGELTVIPAAEGAALDVEASLVQLQADPQRFYDRGVIELALVPLEPSITDVSAARKEAEELLGKTFVINAWDPILDEQVRWEVARDQIAPWIEVVPGKEGPQIHLREAEIAAYVQELSAQLGSNRYLEIEATMTLILDALKQNAEVQQRIRYSATGYKVKPGDTLLKIGWEYEIPHWRIREANPFLAYSSLQAGQELVIPSKDDLIPLEANPEKRIVISIAEQRLRTYQHGQLLNEYIVSTGVEDSPTQPGVFQVQTHELNAYASRWDLYMPHFLGIYEASPGFMNGIHGLPLLSSGKRLWEGVLGQPVSYGCIVMGLAEAEKIYNWAENGVIVEINP